MKVESRKFWRWFLSKLKNKFFLTAVIFLLWMLIFDSSNWISMWETKRNIQRLENERDYYIQKIGYIRLMVFFLNMKIQTLQKQRISSVEDA